jgi:DNA-binding PadR family transcriptional regulator
VTPRREHHTHHSHTDHVERRGDDRSRDGRRLRHGPHPHGGDAFDRFGPGRRRRSKRGDVRAAVLLLLEEQSRNGYQLIQELDERSHGAWRPSPGSIYPILSQLEDEGLVVGSAAESGRTFTLTPAGQAAVHEGRERFGRPWDTAAAEVGEGRFGLMRTTRQVMGAARQAFDAGSDTQVAKVTEIMRETRRRIYAVLGEEEPTS